MERFEALAKFLGVEVEDLTVSKYDERVFENEEAGEYIVLTEEEADEAAEESIKELINDMGLESFTEDFQQWILDNCVDSDWFAECLEDYEIGYIEEIRDEKSDYEEYKSRLDEEMNDAGVDTEEEFLECLIESAGDPIEWFKDTFGMEEFTNTIEEYNLIDWEAVINEAIEVDGCGHFIATYDGEENEMGEYFIYRLN